MSHAYSSFFTCRYPLPLLVGSLFGWVFFVGVTPATGNPLIVQYQQWFGEYASIMEDQMSLKRTINSNKTLTFNMELVRMLANATTELRAVDNVTMATIQQDAVSIDEQCRQLVLELYQLFRTLGQMEMQGCAGHASSELTYWTTERFFNYANIVHREATELTHRVALVLEQYNKVTEIDSILSHLEDEYYGFNSYNNAVQDQLNGELGRFDPPSHPLRTALFDCLDTTVALHQSDMQYVLSYVDNSCGQ